MKHEIQLACIFLAKAVKILVCIQKISLFFVQALQTLIFLIFSKDYVTGVQNGSIAGTEGITFHSGDGAHDTDMDITSTLANLNLQLGRLYLRPGGLV